MRNIAEGVYVGRVAPGLWVHTTTHRYPNGTLVPSNGMLLESGEQSILIDTGSEEGHTSALLGWAQRTLGKPVARVIVTHAHDDRTGGIGVLLERHIPVFGLPATRRLMVAAHRPAPEAIPVLEKRLWHDPAGFDVFFPGAGHAPDNVVVYFLHPRILFGGCLIKSATATTLGNVADADRSAWPGSIRRVAQTFSPPRLVIPGHGRAGGNAIGQTLHLLGAGTFDGLSDQMAQLAKAAHGRVGAAALLIETGESASLRGSESFPMQSVYKAPISMAVLHEIEQGRLTLEQRVPVRKADLIAPGQYSPIATAYPKGGVALTVRELMQAALIESDGTASDILLRLAGGPERVTGYLRAQDVRDLTVAASEKEMGRDDLLQYRSGATPEAAVQLLRLLATGRILTPDHRRLLLDMMARAATGPHRIKGLLPAGTVVAHKTGTAGTRNGLTRATNDIGIVTLPDGRHLAIAVFVADSRADTATREGVIARIARAAWDRCVRKR